MRGVLALLLLIAPLGAAAAQQRPGAPAELVGVYAPSRDECRSFHRNPGNVLTITTREYTWCATSECYAQVLRHRRTRDGFVLTLRSNRNTFSATLRQRGPNAYEQRFSGITARERIVRCGEDDIIAGIGLPAGSALSQNDPNLPDLAAVVHSPDGIFSAAYARAIPDLCPGINADEEQIGSLITRGRQGLLRQYRDQKRTTPQGWSPERAAADEVAQTESDARLAVQDDAQAVKDFCAYVLDVFGPTGRVIANLLRG